MAVVAAGLADSPSFLLPHWDGGHTHTETLAFQHNWLTCLGWVGLPCRRRPPPTLQVSWAMRNAPWSAQTMSMMHAAASLMLPARRSLTRPWSRSMPGKLGGMVCCCSCSTRRSWHQTVASLQGFVDTDSNMSVYACVYVNRVTQVESFDLGRRRASVPCSMHAPDSCGCCHVTCLCL